MNPPGQFVQNINKSDKDFFKDLDYWRELSGASSVMRMPFTEAKRAISVRPKPV